MSFGSIPPIDQSTLPEQVRNGSPQDQKAYTAALGFEEMLVEQLTQSMTDSMSLAGSDGLGGDDSDDSGDGLDDTSSSADSPYASMLPDALTQGIMQNGGLGIAQQLAPSLGATDLTELSS